MEPDETDDERLDDDELLFIVEERVFPALPDTFEPVRVLSLLETLASDVPEDVPLLVVTEDERLLSELFCVTISPLEEVERELIFVPVDDEREVTPSRFDNDRELSPSLNDVLRLVSVLPLRNEELLLSIDELLP